MQDIDPCPTRSDLEQLCAGNLAVDEMKLLEVHLTHCAMCRMELDRVADVHEVHKLSDKPEIFDRRMSPSLDLAIDRLLSESSRSSEGAIGSALNVDYGLPRLLPADREGFIGRLGDIDIRKVLGRGGMGVVFEGVDRNLQRTVAVKVLSPYLVSDEGAKRRFLKEAQAAAVLTHPTIVQIYSIHEADGLPFLVLEFIQGESLADRLRREVTIAPSELIRLGTEIAKGLSYAHARGLIHRDVKPANILIERATGAAHLADFGLAKQIDSQSLTQLGAIAGTPAYMSPEQTTGQGVDQRTDLFSLGLVLYEASTGVHPFAADSPYVTMCNIRERVPQSAHNVNAVVPLWLSSVIDQLLAKHPEDRIASAQALINALENERSPKQPSRATETNYRSVLLWLGLLASLLASLYLFSATDHSNQEKGVQSNTQSVNSMGFFVDNAVSPLKTFREAIEAARDQSLIEIQGNGPFPSESISIEGKRLTIRARPGCIPRFVPSPSTVRSGSHFIHSDRDLNLEGVEIIWPVEFQLARFEDTGERCVVAITNGNLNVTRCRIIAGRLGCCIGGKGTEMTIRNCDLVSKAGACIVWPGTLPAITIEQCSLESRTALMTKNLTGPSRSSLKFVQNTVQAERFLTILSSNLDKSPLQVVASQNIFDNQVLIAITFLNGVTPNQQRRLVSGLRDSILWKDQSNIYRRKIMYLAGNPRNQPFSSIPSNLDTLDEWLMFWSQDKSDSIEGSLRLDRESMADELAPLRLDEATELSGPLPASAGSAPQTIGPRTIQ